VTTGEYPLLYVLHFGAGGVEKLKPALGNGGWTWRDDLLCPAECVEGDLRDWSNKRRAMLLCDVMRQGSIGEMLKKRHWTPKGTCACVRCYLP